MKKIAILLLGLALFTTPLSGQDVVTINGYVYSDASGEALANVPIKLNGYLAAVTNSFGYFSIQRLDNSALILSVKFLDFKPQIINLSQQDPNSRAFLVDIRLTVDAIAFEELIVEADMDRKNLELPAMGTTTIPTESIKNIPVIGGEADVIKALQSTPGVMSGQELSNGLYVRGGSFDQNQILLDGIPLYNPNHLFGFFSVFNTDVLSHAELLKGGIPAEYGGRLSSVLNLTMREGNREHFAYSGGVSLMTSRLALEGPIGKDKKGSYLFAGRRTYLDPVFALANSSKSTTQSGGKEKISLYFYDLNAKANYEITDKDHLFISAYLGRDNLQDQLDKGRIGMKWGNQAYNLRYNRVWSPTVFTNFSLIYSDYASEVLLKSTEENSDFRNVNKKPAIQDAILRGEINYNLTQDQSIKTGFNFTKHWFKAFSGIQETENQKAVSLESYETQTFLSHDWSISDRLRSQAGVQAAYFHMGDYWALEPRVNLRYLMNENTSLKASYTRMHQFIHVLSSLNLVNPGDIYYPSTDFLKPERSSQYALGMVKLIPKYQWELTIDTYYKDMDHLPLFKQSFSSADPQSIAQDVVLGKGWAYGLEVGIQKSVGRSTGWANYTLSKPYRKYAEKNGGKVFTPKFDRSHQFNLVWDYQINKRWKFGSVFVLASGQPITVPKQVYYLNDQDGRNQNFQGVIDYGQIYSQRLPWYNRLDVSLTYRFYWFKGNWDLFINVYNVYGYKNPLFVNYNDTKKRWEQTSIGYLPTFGVSFEF